MENYRCFEPAQLGTVAIRVKLSIVHMGAMVDQYPMTNEIGKSLIDRLETNKKTTTKLPRKKGFYAGTRMHRCRICQFLFCFFKTTKARTWVN